MVPPLLRGARVPDGEGKAVPVPDWRTPPVGAAKPEEIEKELDGASCRRTMSRGAVLSRGAADARSVIRPSRLVKTAVLILSYQIDDR